MKNLVWLESEIHLDTLVIISKHKILGYKYVIVTQGWLLHMFMTNTQGIHTYSGLVVWVWGSALNVMSFFISSMNLCFRSEVWWDRNMCAVGLEPQVICGPSAHCLSGIGPHPSAPTPMYPHLTSSFISLSLSWHGNWVFSRGGCVPPLPSSPVGCICRWGEGQERALFCFEVGPRRGHPRPGWQCHGLFDGWFTFLPTPIQAQHPAGMEVATLWGLPSPSIRTLDCGKGILTFPLSAGAPHFYFCTEYPTNYVADLVSTSSCLTLYVINA